ncbi:SIMPL domain-containing protein [Aquibium carbonis]|uniref:SIMPL domain-containing protein n=1 Tax=Aquibium carbonis TaxID=2495581 RepID=A0A3R9Y1J4_9HYPH|nr:SIMPL domain-containing protein [Aquibium carbonis]RST82037.1 SIMPL domain-containing protein [Aquibium carbonis]
MSRALPFLAASILAVALLPAAAQGLPEQKPRISVTGEGEESLRPDMALLSFSVMRQAETAREALSANNEAMAQVIAALKADGVDDRDLQTAGIQINPRYDYPTGPDGRQRQELTGYEVSNTLTVRVRDVQKTGAILDKVVSLGVNQGGGISFTNTDPAAAIEAARREAVENAIAKARTLAQAAGVELGPIMEIFEMTSRPHPMPQMAMKVRAEAADTVPVEAGENSYRVEVTMSFAIAQ